MSIKKITLIVIFSFIFNVVNAEENLKSLGKFKDWESFILLKEGVKVCFAQSIPIVRAPKKLKREPSRLFVSFRPAENIQNEVSVTNGYEFKLKAPVAAKSGKKSYDLFSKGRFAWAVDNEEDKKLIWRKYVNEKLKGQYKRVFSMIDHFIFIKVPSFDMVFKWRLLQEQKLKKRSHSNKKIMTYNQIKRFIMFYQRITLQMTKDLSKSASVVMFLNKNHNIKKILFRRQ